MKEPRVADEVAGRIQEWQRSEREVWSRQIGIAEGRLYGPADRLYGYATTIGSLFYAGASATPRDWRPAALRRNASPLARSCAFRCRMLRSSSRRWTSPGDSCRALSKKARERPGSPRPLLAACSAAS